MKTLAKLMAAWAFLPLFFLATGGALNWWEAWAYCALLLVPMTIFTTWMARRDPAFFDRRFKLKEREGAQRRILTWGSPFIIALFVVPGLDHRLGWSEPPLAATVVALALSLGGYLVILRAFLENRWAGRTVETWTEQEVISSGPYAIVRHPMYSGVVVMWLATPVALGSWWALLPALAVVPILVLRIVNEEQVLVRELPGYEEYRRRVRYRLVPFAW